MKELGLTFYHSLLYKYHVDRNIIKCICGLAALRKTIVATNME